MKKEEYEFLDVPLQNMTIEQWLDAVLDKTKEGWRLYATAEEAEKPGGISLPQDPSGLVIIICMDRIFAMWEKAKREGVIRFARKK